MAESRVLIRRASIHSIFFLHLLLLLLFFFRWLRFIVTLKGKKNCDSRGLIGWSGVLGERSLFTDTLIDGKSNNNNLQLKNTNTIQERTNENQIADDSSTRTSHHRMCAVKRGAVIDNAIRIRVYTLCAFHSHRNIGHPFRWKHKEPTRWHVHWTRVSFVRLLIPSITICNSVFSIPIQWQPISLESPSGFAFSISSFFNWKRSCRCNAMKPFAPCHPVTHSLFLLLHQANAIFSHEFLLIA